MQPLPHPQIRALRALLSEVGEPGILGLGLSRHQLQRCLAGMSIQAGTRAQVERVLHEHRARAAAR